MNFFIIFQEYGRQFGIYSLVVHWKAVHSIGAKAVQRHMQTLGFLTCRERVSVNQVYSKLLALPFLPGHDIERGFRRLKAKAVQGSDELTQIFSYIEDQRVISMVSTGMVSIQTTCLYQQWPRELAPYIEHGNLPFYVLVPMLLQEAQFVDIQCHLVSLGEVLRNRCALYMSMNNQINKLWDKYDDHDITAEDFLTKVGEIYGRI